MTYRSGDENSPLRPPSPFPTVWLAWDKRTGARLGPVVSFSLPNARMKAAELYAVPFEVVGVEMEERDG